MARRRSRFGEGHPARGGGRNPGTGKSIGTFGTINYGGGGRAVLSAEHGMGGRVAQQDTSRVVIDRRPIVLESGGFDRADAGIGVAGAAGLVLVSGGAVLLARRGRREQIATT